MDDQSQAPHRLKSHTSGWITFQGAGHMACDPDVCVSSGTRLVLESLKICGRAKRLLARPARGAELFVPNWDELCAWHKNEDHPHSYPRGMFQLSHR
jgi:hypothetical protein